MTIGTDTFRISVHIFVTLFLGMINPLLAIAYVGFLLTRRANARNARLAEVAAVKVKVAELDREAPELDALIERQNKLIQGYLR